MSDAARLRAQKAYSTDPAYLERMALAAEVRDTCVEAKQAAERFPAQKMQGPAGARCGGDQ